MASEADERRDKIQGLRSQWKTAFDEAKGENLKVGERRKRKIDRLLKQVGELGFSTKAWKKAMVQQDHVDDAKGVWVKIKASDDVDLIGQFADLTIQTADALPLFDAATQRELKAAIRAKEKADADAEKQAAAEEEAEDEGDDDSAADERSVGTREGAAIQ